MSRPRLLFVSPRFLFPIDSGGKIRTTGILREMKGGHYDITLLSPAPADGGSYEEELASVADQWAHWDCASGLARLLRRFAHLFHALPLPVATDISTAGRELVAGHLAQHDVAVFDFIHSAVLAPTQIPVPSVMFTHNVESDIFERHAKVNSNPLARWVWRGQWRKMHRFEGAALRRFDRVIAVSDVDKERFSAKYDHADVDTIATGVDLNFFPYRRQGQPGRIVFTGSMDWMANQDCIAFFMDEIWPHITRKIPDASMTVVGRAPPERLVARARGLENWEFSGFVDDVRPYIHRASVYVIPLRVGGGTRLKVFEAMASGCPVVSTAIGVEGLDLTDGVHYLNAETEQEFADATCRVLNDPALADKLATAARDYVEANASNAIVARQFEAICAAAMRTGNAPTPAADVSR